MRGDKLWKQYLETGGDGKPEIEPVTVSGVSRRSFLAALGYTAAGISMMSCRVPEQKIVPNLNQPPEQTPGVANWYASTCAGCSAGCGVLVKVRDGRPIKLEGNPDHPLSKGGLCAVAHSLVFSLFDSQRLQKPMIGGVESDWGTLDRQVMAKLSAVKQSGGKVRFLSDTIISPTSKSVIDDFLGGFEDAKHIVYEPVSTSAIRIAHSATHGVDAVPAFRFDRAKLVVSFDADFLGTWISPIQFTRDYAKARDLKEGQQEMMRHIQIESRMSLTGANADTRIKASSAEKKEALILLLKTLVDKEDRSETANSVPLQKPKTSPQMNHHIEKIAAELLKHRNEALVVSGSNDADEQKIVNHINEVLGSYGTTIDINTRSLQSQASDAEFAGLTDEIKKGEIAALFMLNVNPAYDYFASKEFTEGLKKIGLKVSFNPTLDETTSMADFACPTHHMLEAWDDAEAIRGVISFNQPTIAPLFKTRAYQESLLRWQGDKRSFHDALRNYWAETLYPMQSSFQTFDKFWDKSLHDGVFIPSAKDAGTTGSFNPEGLDEAVGRFQKREDSGYSLVLYQKTSMRDGRFANNPWLQELPDPISKTSWDNYACVSPATASKLDLANGHVVTLKKESKSIELPVLVQPGQSDDCIAVALGYGRTKAGEAGNGVGANAFPFVEFENGTFRYEIPNVSIESTGRQHTLARTQTEDTAHERPLIEEYSLSAFINGDYEQKNTDHTTLWSGHDFPVHKWGMAIDLSACTGCNACVLSCQAENNIPVVGKLEVTRRREMHWLRIDRYYEEEEGETKTRFQPLPCLQCDNASCESVCPVLATVHSSEGLNMQVYNRCVGTRYCANNCPYKVRRFNWFEYPHDDPVANLALNPDVTVRSRGVMEKCSFCVQRIEEKKIIARNEGRPIRDGEIQTACQQSCPANAIVFGDLKDLKSRVNEQKKSGRNYVLLEELNRHPAVSYLAKVTNSEKSKGKEH